MADLLGYSIGSVRPVHRGQVWPKKMYSVGLFDHDCWSDSSWVWTCCPGRQADIAIETAAQNTAMFMVSRAIIGVGITPAIVGASSLISGRSMVRRV